MKIRNIIMLMSGLTALLGFAGCQKQSITNSHISAEPGMKKTALTAFGLSAAADIKVLSFNVRHNEPEDPQSITERQVNIRQIIVDNDPDIFGMQEFTNNDFETWFISQMAALGYNVYYDETAGMGTPKVIFYKFARFVLQNSGTVVLGPTNTGTWVILLDNANGQKYFISNSHWQFDSQAVRIQNSQALVTAVQQNNPAGLPEIIFGDFNSQPGSTETTNLKNGLDIVDALGDNEGDPTFHGWDATGSSKLDWILSDRSMAFRSWKVITTSYNGFWPSDHWPVMATFTPGIFAGAHSDVNGKSTNASTKFYFADVNGDGKDDKVYWNPTYDSGRPQVFLSNGDGTFASLAVVHTAGASASAETRYYYADVNGDGKADEITWTPTLNSGHTRVYLATTNGNFSTTVTDNPEGTSAGTTTLYQFADVNGDGKADKIYWNSTVDSGHTRVYLASGNGSFSASIISGSEGASTTGGTSYYYADVNGDSKADKILWHPTLNSGKTMVYLSDGDGTFTASATFSDSGATSAASATDFFFADVNGDGKADKIYWNPNNYLGKIKIYYSTTGNVFDGPVYSLRGTSQSADSCYFWADLNGDGRADQIRWNYADNSGELRNYFAK